MNFTVLFIVVSVFGLVVLLVMPRIRFTSRREKTTVERRSGRDRRRLKLRVPIERRRRNRRTQDAAKAFVDGLAGSSKPRDFRPGA
jgi:hypothetical protein